MIDFETHPVGTAKRIEELEAALGLSQDIDEINVALILKVINRIEAAEAKLAKAVEALAYIDSRICWEINPSNYDHQSVCEMNADWCEVGTLAADTLATLKGQDDD